jgi:hypothetical protein
VLAALLLAGLLALALRILLPLSGFLPATLLLPGFLSLLARILILLLRHLGELPSWTSEERQRPGFSLVALRNPVPRTCGTEMTSVAK